jgi:hypothetical protein
MVIIKFGIKIKLLIVFTLLILQTMYSLQMTLLLLIKLPRILEEGDYKEIKMHSKYKKIMIKI